MRGCALAGLFHLTDQIQGQLTDTELLEQHTFVRKTLFDVATIEEFHQVRRPHLVVCSRLLTASFAQYLLGPLHRTLYTSGTVAGGEHKHEGTIFGVNYIIGGDLRVVGALYEPRGLTLRHAVLCVPRREDITTASGALRVPHTTWDAPLEGCVLLRR